MSPGTRSHLAAAITGGLIVAGGLLAVGATGRRTVETIIQEAPVATARSPGSSRSLTPHAIYQREAPAVVHVSARLIAPVTSPFDVLHQAQTGTIAGSGFLADRRGDVMTAYHLIDGANRATGITVGFEGGVQRQASVVTADPARDVAVLRVDLHGVPRTAPLELGTSMSVRTGDPALAIGNPYGLDRTLSSGIISALTHELVAAGGARVDNVLQTDLPVDPGAAGGPLLDAVGHVIGINSQLTTPEGTTVAFATPVDAVTRMLHGAQRLGRVPVAYLGLSAAPAHGAHPAVTVTAVASGSPAEQAGLRRGDAIIRVAGENVSRLSDLSRMIATGGPGQRVQIEIAHRGRLRTLSVRLGAQS